MQLKIAFANFNTASPTCPCAKLFANNTGLISAANLEINIKDFKAPEAFHSMFKYCSNLVEPPKTLDVLTYELTDRCFAEMFIGCHKLKNIWNVINTNKYAGGSATSIKLRQNSC